MLAQDELNVLKRIFLDQFSANGHPVDMALFTRHESEGRLHCRVTAYFSPAASPVAEEVNASPCNKPTRFSLALLAGAEESWRVLYPEIDL